MLQTKARGHSTKVEQISDIVMNDQCIVCECVYLYNFKQALLCATLDVAVSALLEMLLGHTCSGSVL